MAIRKVKGGYGVFIDDKKNGKIQRTKKGNIRMKNIKTHKSLASAKRPRPPALSTHAAGVRSEASIWSQEWLLGGGRDDVLLFPTYSRSDHPMGGPASIASSTIALLVPLSAEVSSICGNMDKFPRRFVWQQHLSPHRSMLSFDSQEDHQFSDPSMGGPASSEACNIALLVPLSVLSLLLSLSIRAELRRRTASQNPALGSYSVLTSQQQRFPHVCLLG